MKFHNFFFKVIALNVYVKLLCVTCEVKCAKITAFIQIYGYKNVCLGKDSNRLLVSFSLIISRSGGGGTNYSEKILWRKSKESLQITSESVDVAFSSRLANDVFVIIIPKPPRQLLVVHFWFVFPQPPSLGHLKI